MVTEKQELIIKLIGVIVIFSLNIGIIINGLSLTCDKCMIIQKTHIPGTKTDYFEPIKLNYVYERLMNGSCLLRYDK